MLRCTQVTHRYRYSDITRYREKEKKMIRTCDVGLGGSILNIPVGSVFSKVLSSEISSVACTYRGAARARAARAKPARVVLGAWDPRLTHDRARRSAARRRARSDRAPGTEVTADADPDVGRGAGHFSTLITAF